MKEIRNNPEYLLSSELGISIVDTNQVCPDLDKPYNADLLADECRLIKWGHHEQSARPYFMPLTNDEWIDSFDRILDNQPVDFISETLIEFECSDSIRNGYID